MALWSKAGVVGIDIGARNLKGISLKKSKGKVWLDKYFFHDLASGNELYPLEAPLAESLSAVIDVQQLKGFKAIASLNDRDILTHDMILPQMPKSDFDIAVKNEIEEQFALPPAEACFDHVLIGPPPDEEHGTAQVYKIYCSKKAAVEKIVSTLTDAKLIPEALDSSILAQVAMLSFNGYLSATTDHVLIDIGESRITVSLICGDKMVACNVINVGFGTINQVLFETQGLPYEKSELLKVTYDMRLQESEADEYHQQIDEILNDVFYKIQRLVMAYRLRARSKSIKSIYVTGGGSQLNEITQALETYCETPATLVNPFRNIELYGPTNPGDSKIAQLAPFMSTAVGLALRGL